MPVNDRSRNLLKVFYKTLLELYFHVSLQNYQSLMPLIIIWNLVVNIHW